MSRPEEKPTFIIVDEQALPAWQLDLLRYMGEVKAERPAPSWGGHHPNWAELMMELYSAMLEDDDACL